MSKNATRIASLAILFVLSAGVKSCGLTSNPAGFFTDEAQAGYEAWNISKHGTDRFNQPYPLFFRGYNYDGVSPYHVYTIVPFVKLFGLSEWTVRFTAVFWSSVEIVVFVLLLAQFVPFRIAFIGGLILLITPWHFHWSRVNLDTWDWTFLTTCSLLFWVKAHRTDENRFLILAGVFFALTGYCYTPSRAVTPVLFAAACFLSLKFGNRLYLMVLAFLVFSLPSIYYHVTNPHAMSRMKITTNLQDFSYRDRQDKILRKYVAHFDPEWLFVTGDASQEGQPIKRHSIPNLGLLHKYQKPLLAVGVIWWFFLVFVRGHYTLLILPIILFVAPIPDSFTSDGVPFCSRSYLMVVPLTILSAFGVSAIYTVIRFFAPQEWVGRAVTAAMVVAIAIFPSSTLYVKHKEAPKTTSGYWGYQTGPREAIRYFHNHKNDYDQLMLSGNFNAPFMFMWMYDPDRSKCSQKKCFIGDLVHSYRPQYKQLFALRPWEFEEQTKKLGLKDVRVRHKIMNPNGTVELIIFETGPR